MMMLLKLSRSVYMS